MIQRKGIYIADWVMEFYATLWIAPDHLHISFSICGQQRTITSIEAQDFLGLTEQPIRLHQLCFPDTEPPRRAHTGVLPPADIMKEVFGQNFTEGGGRTPQDELPVARALDAIQRQTILPRPGYRNGFTRLQQWIVSYLVRKIPFDI